MIGPTSNQKRPHNQPHQSHQSHQSHLPHQSSRSPSQQFQLDGTHPTHQLASCQVNILSFFEYFFTVDLMFFDIKILFQMLWRPLPARVDRGAEQLSVVNPIEDHQKTMKSATTRQFSDMLVPCTGDASQVAITVGIVQEKVENIFLFWSKFLLFRFKFSLHFFDFQKSPNIPFGAWKKFIDVGAIWLKWRSRIAIVMSSQGSISAESEWLHIFTVEVWTGETVDISRQFFAFVRSIISWGRNPSMVIIFIMATMTVSAEWLVPECEATSIKWSFLAFFGVSSPPPEVAPQSASPPDFRSEFLIFLSAWPTQSLSVAWYSVWMTVERQEPSTQFDDSWLDILVLNKVGNKFFFKNLLVFCCCVVSWFWVGDVLWASLKFQNFWLG